MIGRMIIGVIGLVAEGVMLGQAVAGVILSCVAVYYFCTIIIG